MRPPPGRTLGVLCLVGAMASFTAQDALIKYLSGDYPLHEIVLARTLIGMGPVLLLVRLEGGLRLLASARPWLHLARGGLIVVANTTFFLALAAMPLAEATAVFFVGPLLITILAALILHEPVGPRRWAAVAVGLTGVLIMVRPGEGTVRLVALLPVVAATAYALLQIVTRRLGATDRASAMAFYVQVVFVFVCTGMWAVAGDGRFAPAGDPSLGFLLRAWVAPRTEDLGILLVIGVLSASGGYLIAQAYRVSEPSMLAPFEYTALPLSVLWGLLLFGEWPDGTAALGIAIIVASGLYTLHREAVRAGSPPAPRPR